MLAGRLSGGSSFVLPAGESEEKLLHICSSIIQNISLHPQNRTRLYKAELAGGIALDKLIEVSNENTCAIHLVGWTGELEIMGIIYVLII